MDATLSALLQFYVFSTGRRIFALTQTKGIATELGHTALANHCDDAMTHDRETLRIESQWASDKGATQYAPEAKQVDILVDVALGALRDSLDADARDAAPGDAVGAAAAKLLQTLFPKGLNAVTNAPFVEQLAEVQRIIACLQSPEWTAIVNDLGLGRRVARLVELEKRYADAIAQSPKGNTTFGDVKDARTKGQQLMLQAVAMILGLHPSDSEADLAARGKLLGPILRQNDAIRAYLRARRSIEDVNPDTGTVLTPPDAVQPPPDPASQGNG
ncbi:MAG: hypothetical protein IPM54_28235 [Polyangiaceae bacterium]|nr:hypothetical protein [Polyangiaceae bacterium]